MKLKVALFVSLLFILFHKSIYAVDQNPVIRLYNITDEQINGFAYDPTCPNSPVEVRIYHGDKLASGADRPTICQAKYSCVWPGICLNGNNNGFWCTPRHPLDSSYITDPNRLNNKIAAVSTCRPNTITWLDTNNQSPQIIRTVVQNRENDTIFFDRPKYKIGVSKRFGGAVVEYYNKSGTVDDAAINLVKPAAGESIQTTIFGNTAVGAGKDCFGTTMNSSFGVQGPVYNPTQTGSYCGIPNPSGTQVLSQSANQIQFQVHYRNFTYPQQSSDAQYRLFQPYDDVWGKITYNFTDDYIRIDYDIWKTGSTTYGLSTKQLPIAFLNNLTKFTYQEQGQIKTMTPTIPSVVSFQIKDNTDGRWFTGESAAFTASDRSTITPEPQNAFLTMAMYSGPIGTTCPARHLQINNVPFGFGSTYLSQIETTTVAAQNYIDWELKQNEHLKAQSYIFPYRHTDSLPGKTGTLSSLLSTTESNGGFVPTWECNYTQTPPSPSTPPTPTPSQFKPGDINLDGKVDSLDLNILLPNFGKTGVAGFSAADIDKNGVIDLFDFNILSQHFTGAYPPTGAPVNDRNNTNENDRGQ